MIGGKLFVIFAGGKQFVAAGQTKSQANTARSKMAGGFIVT
jgi:hypothetical protein